MFQIIRNLIGYVLSTSNWLLLLGGVTIVSYLFFAHLAQVQSMTIDKAEIVNAEILPNEQLQVRFHASINVPGCDIYAERAITDGTTGLAVWQSVSPINPN